MKLPLKPYDTENQYLTRLFNISIYLYNICICPNSKLNDLRIRKFCFEGISLKPPIPLSWFIYFMSLKLQFLLYSQQNLFFWLFKDKNMFFFWRYFAVQLNVYLHLNMQSQHKNENFQFIMKMHKNKKLKKNSPLKVILFFQVKGFAPNFEECFVYSIGQTQTYP